MGALVKLGSGLLPPWTLLSLPGDSCMNMQDTLVSARH